MDSGLAALLGAAIGSVATLGAAMVNGGSQARSQHAQQSRQHRRDAYARYLGPSTTATSPWTPSWPRCVPTTPTGPSSTS
ncbi:hypothetical protein ACIQU8_24540 [Streptomyces griseus]|uniref:hypothetical protein n=1 Tax=Streptomyces griseus TaxID=1911 RepID=UPI00380573C9